MGGRRSSASPLIVGVVAIVVAAAPVSSAGGVTWRAGVQVGPIQRLTCERALATTSSSAGTVLHATYLSANGSTGVANVFARRSVDGGATWTSGATLSANQSVYKVCPTIAGSGTLLIVAWHQETATASAIRYRISTNGGVTWRPEARLPTRRAPGKPSVAVAGSTIAIAWTDGSGADRWSRIAISRNLGATWAMRGLDAKPTQSDDFDPPTPQVAASGSRIFAAWLRTGGTQLVGRASTDGGATWPAAVVLGSAFPPVQKSYTVKKSETQFSIAARPDRMAIAWTGGWPATPDIPEVSVRVFAPGAWAAPSTLTASSGNADAPYGYFFSPAVTLLSSSRVGIGAVVCTDLTAIESFYGCGEPYGGGFFALWSESANNGATWTPLVDVNGGLFTWVGAMSAIWSSASLRGVLVSWANGEPDWDMWLRFVRGTGLP